MPSGLCVVGEVTIRDIRSLRRSIWREVQYMTGTIDLSWEERASMMMTEKEGHETAETLLLLGVVKHSSS